MASRSKIIRSESEEHFRLLVEGVTDYAIFMMDPGGHVMSWNTGAERITGYPADEIIGQHFRLFYPPEDHAWDKPGYELLYAAKEGRFEDIGWRVRKDGTRFWANAVITAMHDKAGKLRGYAKVTRDITERRVAELEREELLIRERAARTAAERAVRQREEFLSIAAHELKTPLTTIKGYVQWLIHCLQEHTMDQQFSKVLAPIERQVYRLELLVADLLDASRIQQGRLVLRHERVDLSALARQALADIDRTVEDQMLHTLVLEAPEPVVGWWDPARLNQVLTNLLSNALKYSPAGGEVRVCVCYREGQAEVAITDEGIGIPAEEQDQLFQPFVRGEHVQSGIGGVGLGLYITAQIVAQHGGMIKVESTVGAGSTFTVRLPLDPPTSTGPAATG